MKILIKNGMVVNYNAQDYNDILLENEKILKIGRHLDDAADQVIDAQGKYVIPGGIDTHVHFALPTFAGLTADDFYTGSRAALQGGTTTVIDFVTPLKGQSLVDAYMQRREEASQALTNVHLHVSPVEWTDTTADEMERLVKDYGVTSFKVYMAYKKSIGIDDNVLIKVLEKAKELDALVIVHCENDEIIEYLRDKYVAEGKTSPVFHPLSRPDEAEAEAIYRLYTFAKALEVPVYAVHVSTYKGLDIIRQAKFENVKFYAETCPQYLVLTDDVYSQGFEQSAKYVMSPPLRSGRNVDLLWHNIYDFDTIGTDHCSFTMEQKRLGKDDFRKIPNGAGGVEHRLELLYTFGVARKKLSMMRFVELTSYRASKLFKLKNKGLIAEGYDADIVIWNPEKKHVISAKNHVMNTDINIYEGIEVTGEAETVILGGKIVKHEGKLLV